MSYSTFLYLSLRHTLYTDLEDELALKTQEIVAIVNSYVEKYGTDRESLISIFQRITNSDFGSDAEEPFNELTTRLFKIVDKYDLREAYMMITDKKGVSLAKSRNLSESKIGKHFQEIQKKMGESAERYDTVKAPDLDLRVISKRYILDDGNEYVIQIGNRLKHVLYLLKRRLFFNAVAIPCVLIFASFFGWLLALRILKPVTVIADTARRITHEDLSSRIMLKDIDEEMVYLVNSFNDMIARLEKSFKYIQEFSSQVAHELKTPLAVIRGETELMLRKDRSPEEYREAYAKNLKAIQGMIRVIDDMLLLTTLEYDVQGFRMEPLELENLLKDLYEEAKILAENKNIHVSLSLPPEPFPVRGDELHLKRLFLNLIDNAIKFSRRNEKVEIHAQKKDKNVEVFISDTGPGIPELDLPKIFDKFFHRERTVNAETSSHGLGLSIALSIAKAHSGDITVKSKLHEGTIFTVSLPLIPRT